MKIKLTVIGIITLLVCIEFSGCTTNSSNKQENVVQLSDIVITTRWQIEKYTYPIKYHTELGFYHNIPSDAFSREYVINGTATNNAELRSITITADLYDINDNLLQNGDYLFYAYIYGLPRSYSKDFTISISEYSTQYFDQVDHVQFRIT